MPIDPEVLYLQLGRLVVSMPELRGNAPITPEINQWLGRAIHSPRGSVGRRQG